MLSILETRLFKEPSYQPSESAKLKHVKGYMLDIAATQY